jgi:TRAP-type C4-dicarboxylate transport system permease small subunit
LQVNLAWLYAAPAVGGVLIVVYGLAAAFEAPNADELQTVDAPNVVAAGGD